jgi:hypothetical protein
MGTIEALKASLPPPPKGDKARSKSEQNHEALIEALTLRTEKLDAELAVRFTVTYSKSAQLTSSPADRTCQKEG